VQVQSTRRRRTRQRKSASLERHQVQELLWPGTAGPVFRHRTLAASTIERERVTRDGGLALAHQLVTRLGLDRSIDRHLHLLQLHLPYHESDHVLTHAYNLFIGGRDLVDIQDLQHSTAVKNLLGACRIPDPTTAGDFLQRFSPVHLECLQEAIDEARVKVWRKLPRRDRQSITMDMDSSFKKVYGVCKQGADFSYKKEWSYHPLLFTLAETGECLRLINRPGNRPSAEGAAEELGPCLDLLTANFRRVYLRGDSKFAEKDILRQAEEASACFAIVHEITSDLWWTAFRLPETAWKEFRAEPGTVRPSRSGQRRRRRPRVRRRIARRRGYSTLSTVREWVAEIPYCPGGFEKPFRLVFKRQWIRDERQEEFFTHYEYRAVISNIPKSEMSPSALVHFAYRRCNQENAIEQAKNGLGAMRMPTGELLANGAFLLAAEIAWCLRAWLSLLALPRETRCWEWGWFRRAFVHAPAKIIAQARSAVVSFYACHRFAGYLLAAMHRLKAMQFR
jgi:hypothetical protein